MTYQVIWSEKSRKNLDNLDKATSSRIITKVESIKEEPLMYVKRLQGVKLYSLRVGEYRVILDIEKQKIVIFVVKVGLRNTVYDDV